ncbi:MAG: hypothetical protein GY867_01260, partial [bacterium]|nr:hypothetical protein [bacterium]
MTNFKKGLSFSVFAVMALAFCLVIGQVVAGDLPTKAQLQQERNTGKSDLQEPGIQTTMDKSVVVPVETSGLKSVADVDDIEREKPARPRLAPQTVIDNGTPRTGGETIGTATVIGALPYVDDATTVGAVDDYDEACPDASTSADVVYAYTPTVTDTIVVSLCGSVLDTKVFVYENTTATLVDCNDDYCGYQSEIPFMEVIGGNTYYIVVDGWGGDEGPYHLEVFKWDPAKCVAGDV